MKLRIRPIKQSILNIACLIQSKSVFKNVDGLMRNVSKVSCVCYAGCAYYIYVRPLARGIVAKSFYPQIVNGKAKGGLHVGGKGSWTYAKWHY